MAELFKRDRLTCLNLNGVQLSYFDSIVGLLEMQRSQCPYFDLNSRSGYSRSFVTVSPSQFIDCLCWLLIYGVGYLKS